MIPIDHLQDLISHFNLDEGKPIKEKIYMDIWFFLNDRDMAGFLDKMKIDISRLVGMEFNDKMDYHDEMGKMLTLLFNDWNKYKDEIYTMMATYIFGDRYYMTDIPNTIYSTFTASDKYSILDKVEITPYFE